MSYTMEYRRLQVTALTPEFHEKTCGYWYTVTRYGGTAHTAFATRHGLMRWLAERGLTLDGELPGTLGEYATMPVTGQYRSTSHGEFAPDEDNPHRMVAGEEWSAVKPVVITSALSNGRYTLALISEDYDGVRTVHTLNPNVRDRLTADGATMRALMS
jgi:hypothetical protein